ncbi:NAD(P)H-dependent oxidoreductase [Nocardia otitidiscaviarum]|uniref:NAD(P)H-dependent oxidoreductase n=1 Tax=Nocardia otitidiscaviarum TaxID=1823 RepID=A0A516NS43_9NOCA|nr:NAD(P)H-dependent oxidoreductase [Nocardia otitidiscaviarum]MBF6133766.1 NAD(P)H-dependent oxidoreductase [Nocardia otitidiscaviarum]MBF6179671.1 NAD(P)H-dependent oxidoreductase [Nocardia otitidiscaviarum]MBF6235725.1 NAD(P)H-dependent oxidoreductase [Nocardia otitidiscaviarum]MBF6487794.1 NAD(P)H-dependent oxidoreductase [Nocardia otitidiscaviarum]MCP9620962.1 NAD(P)H-dependent oxidoreductase [Nocardia otitidiscaviarum]
MDDPVRLEVIVASTRPGRFAPVVADWFLRAARGDGRFDVGVVDLLDTPLPVDLSETPEVLAYRERVAAADAFVAVTSEYNHGYPASLKTALDSAKREWRGKPIGFVSYGGLSGGLRAVEQLRQVVAEIHMVSIRETVSFHEAKRKFDAAGETADGAAVDAAGRLLRQLDWWGRHLRAARASEPYPG